MLAANMLISSCVNVSPKKKQEEMKMFSLYGRRASKTSPVAVQGQRCKSLGISHRVLRPCFPVGSLCFILWTFLTRGPLDLTTHHHLRSHSKPSPTTPPALTSKASSDSPHSGLSKCSTRPIFSNYILLKILFVPEKAVAVWPVPKSSLPGFFQHSVGMNWLGRLGQHPSLL